MAPATTTSNNSSAAAATNWLSFSLSPMEMLRSSSSSSQSQFMSYEGSSSAAAPSIAVLPAPPAATASHHHYFIDNFYAPPHGWANPKETQAAEALAETSILTSLIVDPETQHQVPKLEDFLGDSSSIVRYSDNSQTETQDDSSLTHIYDPNSAANYFSEQQDLKAIAGFPAFSANSGSEVDDSASIARTHHHHHHHHHHHQHHQLGGGGGCATEFPGHSIESAGNELCLPNANNAALSLGVNSNATATTTSNTINQACTEKGLVPVASAEPDCDKKIADTFGQRTSIYRGVTRHRWTGRYEAHLWDNSCRREGQARKGRQVYLGGYDKEVKAARAYDLAALKYWGPTATTNFPVSNYTKELEDMKYVSKQEFIASLRRKSSGFSRGASIYRGVTRHHQQGRWQARIGRVAGNKDLYLGTFATEEEAAEAYDIAAIKFRGMNAVTNFEMSRYDVEAIMKSTLPIGGAAKRLKLSVDAEQKPLLDQQPHCSSNSISFGSVHPVSTIPCGVPFDPATTYYHHHNLFHHLQAGGSYITTTDSSGSNSSLASQMTMVPQTTEFYIWPHQSY